MTTLETLSSKITATTQQETGLFGTLVALSGDYMAAVTDKPNDFKVEFFYNNAGTWESQSVIQIGTTYEFRPNDMAMYGNFVALGLENKHSASADDDGQVLVYGRSGTTWSLHTTINSPVQENNYNFGRRVTMHGDYLVVSASLTARKLYIYKYNSGTDTWTEPDVDGNGNNELNSRYVANTAYPEEYKFATGISLYTDSANDKYQLAIGLATSGNEYYFKCMERNTANEQWTDIRDSIVYPNQSTDTLSYFGYSIGIYDDTVAVGAYSADNSNYNNAGIIYIYIPKPANTNVWKKKTTLQPPLSFQGSNFYFGKHVKIIDGYILSSSPGYDVDSTTDVGYAFLYSYNSSTTAWSLNKRFQHDYTTASSDRFGTSIALDEEYALISAPHLEGEETNSGAVYEYQMPAYTENNGEGASSGGGSSGGNSGAICFLGDSLLQIDNRPPMSMEHVFSTLHSANPCYTINGWKIWRVTKCSNSDSYMIKICAGAFGEGVPSKNTYSSLEHKILVNGILKKAKNLVNGSTIKKVYTGPKYMYNVLLSSHQLMTVNNMQVETLHPDNKYIRDHPFD